MVNYNNNGYHGGFWLGLSIFLFLLDNCFSSVSHWIIGYIICFCFIIFLLVNIIDYILVFITEIKKEKKRQ